MQVYHAKYGGPEDLRDVRDALTEFAESNEAENEAIQAAFAIHGIVGWGPGVELKYREGDNTCFVSTGPGDQPMPGHCENEYVQLSLTGPGGFDCTARVDADAAVNVGPPTMGDRIVSGAADHIWADDCWTSRNGQLIYKYPFLPGRAHRNGVFTLKVTTHCISHPKADPNGQLPPFGVCPSQWFITTEFNQRPADDFVAEGFGAYVSSEMTVANNSTATIAIFTADGRTCALHPGPEPCNL